MLRVGVVGASGFVGGEMLRLLVTHPKVDIAMVTSRQHVGEYLHRIQPSLKGFTEMTFSELDYDKMSDKCDLVFTAVPHGTATCDYGQVTDFMGWHVAAMDEKIRDISVFRGISV